MTREVVVVSAVRTAIGTFGGSLKDVPPTELGALVVKESLVRAGVEGKGPLDVLVPVSPVMAAGELIVFMRDVQLRQLIVERSVVGQ